MATWITEGYLALRMDAALVSNLAVEPIARASYVIMFALSEASIKPL